MLSNRVYHKIGSCNSQCLIRAQKIRIEITIVAVASNSLPAN